MRFIRHAVRFITNRYSLLLTGIVIIGYVLLALVLRVSFTTNNMTWIYSSSMQTLAALIALLPISYGYYISNLDTEKNDNLDSYIINRLKADVYYDMMTVIAYSLIVIVINLLSFFTLSTMNGALIIGFLTIEGIGLISLYIYRLFDPNKVKEILTEYDTSKSVDPNQKVISLDTFITEYLKLESAVKDYISNENDNELVDRLPLYDIVDNLSKDFPDIQEHFNTFKEIIFHRNNLIHNYTDTVVDYAKYAKVIELTDLFEKYNNAFIQKRIFGNVVAIKNTIEKCLKEYLADEQNESEEPNTVPEDYKEDVISLLHSYFISEYYDTVSMDEATEADFEVIQNNYSERKLLGIDVKSIQPRNLQSIATSYFKRLQSRFMYVFLINYNPTKDIFVVMYQTKDKGIRSILIS